jgi:hypothetical protein
VPRVEQGGSVTLDLLSYTGSNGSLVDVASLSLSINDEFGNPITGFPVVEPAIVRTALGTYHYLWNVPLLTPADTYLAHWSGVVDGNLRTADEYVIVALPGSFSISGLDFLVPPDDYDAIRALLGVTTLDLTDDVIQLPAFAQQAEHEIKRRVSNWSSQIGDSDNLYVLRAATIYATAALLAESWVHGGTIGFVRPLETGGGRKWDVAAASFWAKYNYWLAIADQSDVDNQDTSLFTIRPIRYGGPTRHRKTVGYAMGRLIPWWRDPDRAPLGPDIPIIPQ